MKMIIVILLLSCACALAQTYTEFYCDATAAAGTNVNAGSTTAASAVYTSTNGNWDGTSVFTPVDGSTPASTVSAGMWLSVYYDGSTNLVQSGTAGGGIGLITNVSAGANGAITIDRRTVSGTVPTSNATGRSVKVGGSWAGPYKTINFPFGFITGSSTNGNNITRVNFKNASTYAITAAVVHNSAGPTIFQGYTSSPGDGGRALISDSTTSASYALVTFNSSAQHINFVDFEITDSFTSGATHGLTVNGTYSVIRRCAVHGIRLDGILLQNTSQIAEDCEAYNCDVNNSAGGFAGFTSAANGTVFLRCFAHDNANNANGFQASGAATSFVHCISSDNGHDGFGINIEGPQWFFGCDSYGNGHDGWNFLTASTANEILIENCNAVKNTGWGIENTGSVMRYGLISNCGFGSGTQANGSGNINTLVSVAQVSNVTYPANVTPWVDPANGNFSINLLQAKSAGRGSYLETSASLTAPNTVGYPDVGAAQSKSTNSASAVFAQ